MYFPATHFDHCQNGNDPKINPESVSYFRAAKSDRQLTSLAGTIVEQVFVARNQGRNQLQTDDIVKTGL
jgi:hypothetical protein